MSPELLAKIIIAFGLAVSVRPLRQLHLGYASRKWPRVPARISDSTGEFYVAVPNRGPIRTGAVPYVHYSYSVGGRAFDGHRVRWGGLTGWTTQAVVAKYPAGTEVAVAVDPSDPSRGVLEPGPSTNAVLHLIYAAMIALAGSLWLVSL